MLFKYLICQGNSEWRKAAWCGEVSKCGR